MKRTPALVLLAILGLACLRRANAQIFRGPDSARQAEKAGRKQQKAFNKASRKQQKALQKAAKKQQKALKKYRKAHRS